MRGEQAGAGGAAEPGALTEAVSVRFGDGELRRVQALAVVYGTTPAAVIRDACGFYISSEVGTPRYREAVAAYQRRAREVADLLEPERMKH